MKRLVSTLLLITLILSSCFLILCGSSFAASSKVIGFPLPKKSTPYNVTVLSRYSSGSIHTSYLYNYGPLKGKTLDSNTLMDIAVSLGTEVYAVADGTIRTVAYGDGGGHYVVIDHGGTYSYYGHLREKTFLKKGAKVVAGQLIGYSGNTGKSSGPHMHFEWSGNDPYCLYESKGLVKISSSKSGAGVYPHTHANPYKKENKCSHKYSGGICKNCGYEYEYKLTAVKAAAYKVSNSSGASIWNRPYSGNSTKLNTIPKNAYVVVIAKTVNQPGNTWYLLSDKTWVYSGNVKSCSMPKNVNYVKASEGLNFRSAPNTSGKILTSIPNGGLVIINPSKKSGNWVYASYPAKGLSGWLSRNYITTVAPKI